MKTYIHAFFMCQSMFCAIPAPQIWDEKARDKMLLFLPVLGLKIGAIWAVLAWLCRLLSLPAAVSALALCIFPYLVTGFIHLDGYMDVTDAVKSWRDLQRRREILKDSHVGSFAVIGLVLLILAQFAFFLSAREDAPVGILALVPAVSRCGSALAVAALKPMTTSQYANQSRKSGHIGVLCCFLGIFLAAGILFWGKYAAVLLGGVAGYALALTRGYRSLEGMNGDIAGYALTVSELCAVAVYALL